MEALRTISAQPWHWTFVAPCQHHQLVLQDRYQWAHLLLRAQYQWAYLEKELNTIKLTLRRSSIPLSSHSKRAQYQGAHRLDIVLFAVTPCQPKHIEVFPRDPSNTIKYVILILILLTFIRTKTFKWLTLTLNSSQKCVELCFFLLTFRSLAFDLKCDNFFRLRHCAMCIVVGKMSNVLKSGRCLHTLSQNICN